MEVSSFPELVASRRRWIDDVLVPWCRRADERELAVAEQTWPDLAGRVSPEFTLWMWAWSRFPGVLIEDLTRFDEAVELRATLDDGRVIEGYPDARQSHRERLVLIPRERGRPEEMLTLGQIASLVPLRNIAAVPDRPLTPSPETEP